MLTVGAALDSVARRYPDKPALIFGQTQRSFAEINQAANRWAAALAAAGLGKGDRVALLLPNGLTMAEAYFGVAKAGVVGVPLNLRWTPAELAYAIDDADVSLILADAALAGQAAPLARPGRPVWAVGAEEEWDRRLAAAPAQAPPVTVDDTDPWVVVYTSGTTGRPKGAVRDHRSNLMIALLLVAELGISADDVGLAVLPMFHVNSMWFVTLSVAIGATCVIYPHRTFHPQHLVEELNRHRATFSMLVPSLLTFLADAAEAGSVDPRWLRVLLTSSAPLDSRLRDRVLRGFPNVRLYDIYGATEYGAVTVLRHRPDGPLGSVGYPILGQEVRILGEDGSEREPGQVGEVFVRGPTLMSGYWRRPEATREAFRDGFLTVGDMGYRTGDGLLYLVDRKADMIIMAGENVYPAEVEDVLLRDPAVHLAAVVGIPDARRGERVVAMVTARPGATVSVERLRALCEQFLADYKRPSAIRVVPELPLGPAGKVVRRLAREAWLAADPS